MSFPFRKFLLGLLAFSGMLILIVCACAMVGLAGYSFYTSQVQFTPLVSQDLENTQASGAPEKLLPDLPSQSGGVDENSGLDLGVLDSGESKADQLLLEAQANLRTIQQAQIPENDLLELAHRLQGHALGQADGATLYEQPIQRTITPSVIPLQIGQEESFWVMNTDRNERSQILARLVYLTDQLYFWIEDGLDVNERAVQELADTFTESIYPTNRQFFGSEWSPGVDGDPRLHILYAADLGNSIAAYFSSADEYPVQVNEYSNQREIFLLNADVLRLNSSFAYGVLAHEFQHMIHWNQDRNEETWLNEGFSDLASFLNGYDAGGSEQVYLRDTDIQLNDWPSETDAAHYGASFLFLTYFLDRFGEQATQAIVSNQANGLASIDQVLTDFGFKDNANREQLNADDLFSDWTVANYLQNPTLSDGQFGYRIVTGVPQAKPTEVVRQCPTEPQDRQVHQYGVDYIRIRCKGNYVLSFSAQPLIELLPLTPPSGEYFFWSNRADESDVYLTKAFDFSSVSGHLSLSYWTWYDLENGYDYVYLLASQDQGQTWQILPTPTGTTFDPAGNSFGWAYTGHSGVSNTSLETPAWIQQTVDISDLAGKQVWLRFEYVTDAAVTGDGFALDDIAIPQIGYRSDFENDEGGWDAQGFVRIQNRIPQSYRLALIENGSNVRVNQYTYTGAESFDIPFQIGNGVNEVILVVSGTTRITRQESSYRFQVFAHP